MKTSYRAMAVTAPRSFELQHRPVPVAGPGNVLVQVEACGVCGADAGVVEGQEAGLQLPRVPGHEIVGRIAALGAGVPAAWRVGQRVGIGRLGGHCLECDVCRQGRFNLCRNQPTVGSSHDGGYAEMILVRHTGLVAVPDELDAVEAAPLLCAGLATFNALKKSGAQAGDLVAVQGIGGLGHLALQYARRMGFKVVAVGRSPELAADALALGAHVYVDAVAEDAAARLRELGGAQLILTTITDGLAAAQLLPALAPRGTLLVVGVGREPIAVPAGLLVGGERVVRGSITGTPYESEKTLAFSLLADVRPRVQTFPLEQAWDAYQWMRSGKAQYRAVLTMQTA